MNSRRGVFALEHALLIVIVVVALVGMFGYFKGAISGKWRAAADTFGHGRQYAGGGAVPPETKLPVDEPIYTASVTCPKGYDIGDYGFPVRFTIRSYNNDGTKNMGSTVKIKYGGMKWITYPNLRPGPQSVRVDTTPLSSGSYSLFVQGVMDNEWNCIVTFYR